MELELNEENIGKMIKIFNFNEAYEMPENKYNVGKGLVEWGKSNDYPFYILDLYNYKGSSTHKSIVNKKVKLISGKGFSDMTDSNLELFVSRNKLAKEVKKATLDYELFNGFAFEVVWNNEGTKIVKIKHIPLHKLRRGIENEDIPFEHFLYSHDWRKYRKKGYEPIIIREFDPTFKKGKQIYVYYEYNPASECYPIADYSTSINWIELDYEISRFHLNQAKQGYAPSFILNFATGIPTEEEQDEFFKEFKRNYSGTENAGKIIITYSEGSDGKPELIPIALNDSDERFVSLMEQIETQIVRGAEIPPQIILLTPGKLGSSDERLELLQEFQQSYVTPRQENLEDVLNEIISFNDYSEKLSLAEYVEKLPVSSENNTEQ